MWSFFIFNDLRREVIICFIDITAIADHANFLFIINDITPKYIAIRRLLKRVLLLVNVKWALIFCQPYLGENVLHIGETMIFDVCPIACKGCHFNPVNPETLTIKTSLMKHTHVCTFTEIGSIILDLRCAISLVKRWRGVYKYDLRPVDKSIRMLLIYPIYFI